MSHLYLHRWRRRQEWGLDGSRDREDRNRGGGNSGVVAVRVEETGKMVGVVATTTAAVVATVVEAREERRVLVVAHSAAKGETRPEPTGAAVPAREEAPEDGETAHEGPQRGTACRRLPTRLRSRTRTTAR